MTHVSFDQLEASLKRAGTALRDAGIPFMLGGGLAIWARGGPKSHNDVDFMVRAEDVERALDALTAAGMSREPPPHGTSVRRRHKPRAVTDHIVQVWDGEVQVDLVFDPAGLPVYSEVASRADELPVASMSMRVMSIEDVRHTSLQTIKKRLAVSREQRQNLRSRLRKAERRLDDVERRLSAIEGRRWSRFPTQFLSATRRPRRKIGGAVSRVQRARGVTRSTHRG
jgi:aminoglycoside-2''-adenylyltransferase